MQYELKVSAAGVGKGTEVEIPGLGVFHAGSTYKIDEEQAEAFRVFHSTSEPVHDSKGVLIGYETKKGRTLLEASKTSTTFEVAEVTEEQEKPATQKKDGDK